MSCIVLFDETQREKSFVKSFVSLQKKSLAKTSREKGKQAPRLVKRQWQESNEGHLSL